LAPRRAISIGGGLVVVALWIHFAWTLPGVYEVRLNDFPAYWAAGKMVLVGDPERIYSTEWKWFTNLPAVSVLFVPLGALEYESAWAVLWWIQVVSFLLTFVLLLYALARYFGPLDPARAAVVALVFFSFAPVMRRCLSLGQTTPLMVLLFVGVYLLAREGRHRLAGGLLGFICLIKIPPLLLLPLLAVRRRFEMAGIALAVVVTGVLASWLFFGGDLMQQYADRVIWDNFGRVHAAFNNQSLDGALMRILSDRGLADWVPAPRPVGERLAMYAVVASLAGLLLVSARSLLLPSKRPPDADPRAGSLELELGLGVALMLLVFPIVWIHYYLFLVVPLCLLPFWWQQREIVLAPAARAFVIVLFVLGVWLAGGQETHENAWYAEREAEHWIRWQLNARPLGALLLVLAFVPPLAVMARRQRDEPADAESTP
jgi:hypothetical protein